MFVCELTERLKRRVATLKLQLLSVEYEEDICKLY